MMNIRRAVLASVVAIAVPASTAAIGVLSAAPAQAADNEFVLTKGHIDLFEVTFDSASSGLRLSVKDDTGLYGAGAQLRDPADVTLAVDEELSATEVPAAPAYSFLGEPGDTVYSLPFTQDQQLPWPGWSTERLVSTLPAGTTLASSGTPVSLQVDVEGPGEVQTWMTNAFGQPINRYVDTVDPAVDRIPVARGAHVHSAWAFTELGEYTLTVTPTATTEQGTTLSGPATDYHVRVGDAAASEPGVAVTPNKPNGEYLYGQGITLDAAPTSPTELDHWHWFVKRAGEPQFTVSDRSSTAQLKLPTSEVWDGAQVYAALYDDDHAVAARSEPLTLSVDRLPEVTDLTATADASSYAMGATATFTTARNPETGGDHFHWYLRKRGEEFFTYVPGSNFATLDLPITADMDDAEVQVRLFDEAHAVIAEADPITLQVGDAAPVATTTTLTLGRSSTTYGTPRDAVVRVVAGDVAGAGAVQVRAGSRVLGRATLTDGQARITLPSGLGVGRHPLTAVFAPADATQAASTSARRTLTVARAGTRSVAKVRNGTVHVTVSSAVQPKGQVVLRKGDRVIAKARLKNGRVALPTRRLARGRHQLVVRYLGNGQHRASQDRVTLRR
jgi:surface-anchored protein